RMIGRLVFAGTIGAVAGPAITVPSGQFMERLGLHPDIGPWAATGVLCGLAALLIFTFLRPDPSIIAQTVTNPRDIQNKMEPDAPARPLRILLLVPKVQLALGALLISQTVMVVLLVMTPLHMDHQHH